MMLLQMTADNPKKMEGIWEANSKVLKASSIYFIILLRAGLSWADVTVTTSYTVSKNTTLHLA